MKSKDLKTRRGETLLHCDGAPVPCLECGTPTNYFSAFYEAPFCSEKCLQDFDAIFESVNRRKE